MTEPAPARMRPMPDALFATDALPLPYVPADPPGIRWRLNANEAPPLDHPHVRAVVREALASVDLSRYPDARAYALRSAIASHVDARVEEVVVGAGSDELVALLASLCARPREGRTAPCLVTPWPSFPMYRHHAAVRGWEVATVPLDSAHHVDLAAVEEACRIHQPNLVFLASPNNPTGTLVDDEAVAALAVRRPETVFVLDEAYAPYRDEPPGRSAVADNLVRLGTLSKVGFAGLRVGWALASAPLARGLEAVRPTFNVSALSQAVAAAILSRCRDEVAAHVALLRGERDRLQRLLAQRGARVTPSQGNFVWVGTALAPDEVARRLAAAGVLVRAFPTGLRVTVGPRAAMDALLDAWPK